MRELSRRSIFGLGSALSAAAAVGAAAAEVGDGAPTPKETAVFPSVSALVGAAAWLRPGDVATVLGRRSPGDGGEARWLVGVSEDGVQADGFCSVALGDGMVATLVHKIRHDSREAGVSAEEAGEHNAAALVALVRHLIARRGGTIHIGERIGCANVVFPPIPPDAAVTFEMAPGAHVTPTNPRRGVFMWSFPAGDLHLTAPNFVNVRIWGRRGERPVCNGVRVSRTNYMTIDNCSAHWIDGCAWQIEGADNARIDIVTFKCGSADGVYAQNFTSDGDKGNVCNDIVLQGTTEQDVMGVNIEGAAIIRDGSALKLHGGAETLRALRLHRCTSVALRLYASLQWNADGFILVTDADNVSGERLLTPLDTAPMIMRGTLDIHTMHNVRWAGTGAAAWCVLDLQTPSSFVKLTGRIDRQATPVAPDATYHHLRIVGPGGRAVVCDLDGLAFVPGVPASVRLRDDRAAEVAAAARAVSALTDWRETPLIDANLEGGAADLRGLAFADLAPARPRVLRDLILHVGQECTICAPAGRITVKHSPRVRLAGSKDFVMPPGATLTLRRVAAARILEVARCLP